MAGLPSRNELKIGLKVEIETKKDQGTGRLTAGILDKILTGGMNHPYGIKVRLQDGQVGRVKKIAGSVPIRGSRASADRVGKITSPVPKESTQSFVDLNTKRIPKTEDKYNEFKEFYQYDKQIEKFSTWSRNKKRNAIKGKKYEVRKRFARVVCSFGNDESGGFVYLGIHADGRIVGLERDKKFGNFDDYDDSFANHITDTLEDFLKDKVFILRNIKIQFRRVDNKTICIVQVLPARSPVYLHTDKVKQFYVRGPAPRAMILADVPDQVRYIRSRFPNY